MSDVVLLSNVRLSFPHLAEPQVQQGENGERRSHNAEFILTPNDPAFQKFMQVVGSMALAKWGEHANAVLQICQADRKKRCYGAGEEKINGKTFKPYDGYAGHVYITAGKNNGMPQIIGPDGNQIDPNNTMACQMVARKMYGGCRVNAAVKPWLQENKHGRAVRCDLVAVQFYADDTPFGEGAVDTSGLFGATPAAAAAPVGFTIGGVPTSPGVAPAMPGLPFPGAAPVAPAAPAWAAPQVPQPGAPSWM